MEQKIYILENLDCANCAAKIESKFNALPEVQVATITFPTRQLRLTADNPDALIEKLTKNVKLLCITIMALQIRIIMNT